MHVKAVVDHYQIANLLRHIGPVKDAVPTLILQYGPFECTSIDDVWAVAKLLVEEEKNAAYEKLKDFAP